MPLQEDVSCSVFVSCVRQPLTLLQGAQTPLGLWLQENEITTLFFGGVNSDQCVWSTLIDAYFKVIAPPHPLSNIPDMCAWYRFKGSC